MFVGSDDELRNNCIFDLKKQINVDSNYDYIDTLSKNLRKTDAFQDTKPLEPALSAKLPEA